VPGYYRLLFAITDPMLSHPVITMPIDGETDEGWTVLGNIDITEAL